MEEKIDIFPSKAIFLYTTISFDIKPADYGQRLLQYSLHTQSKNDCFEGDLRSIPSSYDMAAGLFKVALNVPLSEVCICNGLN